MCKVTQYHLSLLKLTETWSDRASTRNKTQNKIELLRQNYSTTSSWRIHYTVAKHTNRLIEIYDIFWPHAVRNRTGRTYHHVLTTYKLRMPIVCVVRIELGYYLIVSDNLALFSSSFQTGLVEIFLFFFVCFDGKSIFWQFNYVMCNSDSKLNMVEGDFRFYFSIPFLSFSFV